MEQVEYEREVIQWDFISFPDYKDCLDTIQGRPKPFQKTSIILFNTIDLFLFKLKN